MRLHTSFGTMRRSGNVLDTGTGEPTLVFLHYWGGPHVLGVLLPHGSAEFDASRMTSVASVIHIS